MGFLYQYTLCSRLMDVWTDAGLGMGVRRGVTELHCLICSYFLDTADIAGF